MGKWLNGFLVALLCTTAYAQVRKSDGSLWTPSLSGSSSDTIRGDGTVGPLGGAAVPSGAILLINSGTCPTGYSEVSGLDGKTLLGTLNAHGDVGTSGGSDSITPTVNSLTAAAQTFTGSSATSSAVSAGTPAGTNGTASVATVSGSKAGTSTGAFSTIGGVSPGSSFTVPAETFTGSALGTHTHTLTATGTNGTSTVTGTLNSFDNRSAFVKVIFCSKN